VSLRARLVIGLLTLATVGFVVLAGVTYLEQRTFLLNRVDQQARAAAQIGAHPAPAFGRGPGDMRDGHDGAPPGRMPALGPAGGTWVFERDASGAVRSQDCRACYSATAPKLPAGLPSDHPTTIDSGGTRYRVLARPSPSGGSTVAAVPLAETDQTLHRLLRTSALVIAAILAVLGAGAWWLVRIGLRPLERMGGTAGAIAAGDLSRRVETATPRTEVGRLGLALNRMLDRLEEAFARQRASEDRLRRFLADASHELRTPLASIRGYAELFRIGAARGPGDTDKAMERIEAEAARMGVLVEDLLTLARLDEVRPVIREDVDLVRLAGDAVDDARATAPDRDIDLQSGGAAIVAGDPHQLRQVFANLLRNALVHTPAGTSVQVSVGHDGSTTVVEVRDHGHGLPTTDDEALFERFWRAEQGRERGKAGAGLGLAIVAGIVAAHGGAVHAENAEGGGARFVVRLPAGSPAPTPSRDGSVPAAR
jgi:two-component system OmpR family sensor kinase